MISEITFITGNVSKFEDALTLFQNSGIKVVMAKHYTPEIQAKSSAEVASFSADFLKNILNIPFFVMDRSFHIESLKGFPGPYVKYINDWLTPEKILTLLNDETDRKAYWETSISCFLPEKEIVTFSGIDKGSISLEARKGKGWVMDEIFVPDNSIKTLSQYNAVDSTNFWNSSSCWKELVSYLQKY